MPIYFDAPDYRFRPGIPSPMEPPPPPEVPFLQTLADAFNTENDIKAAVDMLQAPHVFPQTPNYDIVGALRKRNLWERRDLFYGVRSDEELDYYAAKIAREDATRERLAAAGWPGFGAQVLAGFVSPTVFFPFVRGATLAKSVVKGGLSVAAGAAAQEAVLFANQETRTYGDAAMSLGSSLLLGGLLGTAAHFLSKAQLDKMSFDMANFPEKEAIQRTTPFTHEPSSVGSARSEEEIVDPGKLKSGLGNWLSFMSPITRGIQQGNAPKFLREAGGSTQVRKMTLGFGQAGLGLERNAEGIAGSAGGNVENLRKGYAFVSYQGSKIVEDAWKEYNLQAAQGLVGKAKTYFGAAVEEGKFNYPEFKREVTLAIWNPDKEVDAIVRKAATEIDRKIFKPLYDEAVSVKIFTGEEHVVGDKGYASRLYDHNIIGARKEEFTTILANNYADNLKAEFQQSATKLLEKMQRDKAFLEDAGRSEEELAKLKAKFEKDLETLDEVTPLDVTSGAAAVRELRNEVTELKRELNEIRAMRSETPDAAVKRAANEEALRAKIAKKQAEMKQVTDTLGEDYLKYMAAKADINRRLKGLGRARAKWNARHARLLERIEQNEQLQIDTMLRMVRESKKFLDMLDSASDEKLAEMASEFKTKFAQTIEKFDKLEEARVKAESSPEINLDDTATTNISRKLDDLAAKIETLDEFDRVEWRNELKDMMRTLAEGHAELNAKRAVRNEKLWQRAEKYSPEERDKFIKNFEMKAKARSPEFIGRWQKRADNIDLQNMTADFSAYARDKAEQVVSRIQGYDRRLAYSDLIQSERGPELARVLDIASEKIKDFLETDIEKIVAVYTRTLGSDISIARVFGEANAEKAFLALDNEQTAVQAKIKTLTDKKGNPLSTEEQAKLSDQTEKFYGQARKDLFALLERARGIRGVPKDPDAWSSRAYKMLLTLNYLRYMGGTVLSSISDPARIVMKHGLARTFRGAIMPMITNWKAIRMAQREAKYAGTALDVAMHTHMYSINDVFEDAYRGTIAERGVQFMGTRFGKFTGMDYWNSAMKQIAAGVTNMRLLDSIALVNGEKGSAAEIRKATEYLARHNITPEIASTIWKEVSNGVGGGKINGVWVPNTEDWNVTDPLVADARRAYRAALAGDVDDTIITPGFERPTSVDASPFARLIFQFRSFMLSSTQKTLMAGLQEKDANFLTGITISLALGYLSYYLYAVTAGGKAYDEMLNADFDKWTDEAITRSGVLGIFDEVQRAAQRIPVLSKYASLSGSRSSRREGGDLIDAMLGPSFDLLEKASGVIAGMDDPTKNTLHMLRQMIPGQNVFYLRYLLDQLEDKIDLPERRTQ